jgi:hypothetical protein
MKSHVLSAYCDNLFIDDKRASQIDSKQCPIKKNHVILRYQNVSDLNFTRDLKSWLLGNHRSSLIMVQPNIAIQR